MVQAIVYTSNTGSTARYAELLGHETGLSVFSLTEAKKTLANGTEIIYLGWVMASGVKGYGDAAKRYRVRMVCAVGMGETGGQVEEIRKQNNIPNSTALFTLQGGFHIDKLHGIYKLMMRMMAGGMRKTLAEKPDRTPAEDDLLDLLTNGGSRVSLSNLQAPIDWIEQDRQN